MNRTGTRALDFLGGCLSTLCAVHCLLKPLLILLPSVALVDVLVAHSTERYLLTAGVLLALTSCLWGYSKHRRCHVFLLLGSALLVIGVGRLAPGGEPGTLLVALGGLMIAANHHLNHRLLEATTRGSG